MIKFFEDYFPCYLSRFQYFQIITMLFPNSKAFPVSMVSNSMLSFSLGITFQAMVNLQIDAFRTKSNSSDFNIIKATKYSRYQLRE